MASIIKEVLTDRNVAAISLTNMLYSVFRFMWVTWQSLYMQALGASPVIIGLITAIRMPLQQIFQFPGGILADKFGRRKVIIYGTSLRMLSPIVYFFASTWQQLIPGIVFESAASIYMPAFNAIIAESLPYEKRGAAFGAYRMVTGLPQVFMPAFSGIFINLVGLEEGMRIGFLFSIFSAIVMLLVRRKFLRETLRKEVRTTTKETKKIDLRTLFGNLFELKFMTRTLLVILLVSIISTFSMRMVNSFLPLYAVEVIGLTYTQWGILQSILGAMRTTLSLPGGMLSDKIGRVPCIFFGRFIVPFRRIGLLFFGHYYQIVLLFVLTSIGAGLGGGGFGGGAGGGPAWSALLADIVSSKDRGKVIGFMSTTTGLLTIPASIIGGYMYDYSPSNLLFSSFFLGIIPAIIFLLFVKEPKERK